MDALIAIASRHSTRTFTAEPLTRDQLETIADAGRHAPCARGERRWRAVLVTEAAARRRIAELTEGGGPFIAQAPACVAVFGSGKYYLEDGCAVAENMLVAATALGLQSCWVAGDKKPYARAVSTLLFAPDDLQLVALLAIGHGAETSRPEARPPLHDLVRWERF